MSVQQLETGLVELGRHIYSQERTDRRRAGFRRQVAIGIEHRIDRMAAS
jgi:hypothetical protein